jgi:hypothetical protein
LAIKSTLLNTLTNVYKTFAETQSVDCLALALYTAANEFNDALKLDTESAIQRAYAALKSDAGA